MIEIIEIILLMCVGDAQLVTLYPPNSPGELEMKSRHHLDPPTFSSHFFSNNATRTFAAIGFRQSGPIQKLSEFISIVFAGIGASSWKKYRTAFIKASEIFTPLQVIDHYPIQCFVGYYLLVNMLTTLHRDGLDPPDGWVAMIVLGNYEHGELCLPDIGVILPYKARDVVFLRALRHFISQFQGNRYVIVFSTSYSIFKWLEMVSR